MAKYGITPESAYGVSIPSLRIYFKVKAEEKALIGVFGKEYEGYRATTGMFFPRNKSEMLSAYYFIHWLVVIF